MYKKILYACINIYCENTRLKACISEKYNLLICPNVLSKVFLWNQCSADKSFQCLYMYIKLKELSLTLARQKYNWTV